MPPQSSTAPVRRGRVRDPDIDARILAVAHRQLSAVGYEAMSLAAVAHQARDIAITALASLLIAALATLYPALQASRLLPVEAMRE